MRANPLAGWLPFRIYAGPSQAMVDWCRLDVRRFDQPFFRQTVLRCLQHPFNLVFRKQTPIEALLESQAGDPGLEPSGFIFHLSRCGSTLAGRMLGALEGSLVMSEPNPIDAVLKAPLPGAGDDARARWLRWLVTSLGRRWNGDERRYFVKCDPWAIRYLPIFERAFPGVPWIFLYRDPLEVLVSQDREQAQFMLQNMAPSFFGIDLATAVEMPPVEYHARVLAEICRAALDSGASAERLVNYTELPSAVWTRIAPSFGFAPSAVEIKQMAAAAGVDAKRPYRQFEPDAADKLRAASAEMREAVDRYVRPLYDELERRRSSAARRSVEPA